MGAWPLLAAEGEAEHHGPEFSLLKELARFINFGIIALVLYLALAKRLKEALQHRQTRIEQTIADSKKAITDAESQLQRYEERVRNVDAEIAQIKQQGEQERAAVLQQMEADARRAAERIVQNAQLNIRQAVEKAKASLQAEAAHLAVQVAENLLKDQMQQTDHERLVRRYIAQIGGSN
jgi:F-type H+-transporting ATPase subunit b